MTRADHDLHNEGWAMPSARAATPSGLSRFASSCQHRIAIAEPSLGEGVYLIAGALAALMLVAGCKAGDPDKPGRRECVDTRTGETFRFHTGDITAVGGLFDSAVVITDESGFRRVVRASDGNIKCRDIPDATAESRDAPKEQPR